ncbi:MAG: hypothetical protein MHMPM18_004392, partial [Marteilia pararefringens]
CRRFETTNRADAALQAKRAAPLEVSSRQNYGNSPSSNSNARLVAANGRQRGAADHLSHCGIELYTDIIVSVNMKPVSPDLDEFTKSVHEKDLCSLVIYSLRNKSYRVTYVSGMCSPSDKGSCGQKGLGCKVMYSTIQDAEANICHVLDVEKGSPAEQAGLKPFSDYIISYYSPSIPKDNNISKFIAQNVGYEVKLVVYNKDMNSIRLISVIPLRDPKANRLLGCTFGCGLAHQLPKRETDENELLKMQYGEQRLIVADFEFPIFSVDEAAETKDPKNEDYEKIIAAYEYHFNMAKNLSQTLKNISLNPATENNSIKTNQSLKVDLERPSNTPTNPNDPPYIQTSATNPQQKPYSYVPIRNSQTKDMSNLDKDAINVMTLNALEEIRDQDNKQRHINTPMDSREQQ